MEPLPLRNGRALLYFDGVVVESLRWGRIPTSNRVPAAWVGARIEQGKHDQLRFSLGDVADPSQPIYGPDKLATAYAQYDIGAAEEPLVREFFAEVARVAGRPGPTA